MRWLPNPRPASSASEFAHPRELEALIVVVPGMALTVFYLIIDELTASLALLTRNDTAKRSILPLCEIAILRRQVKRPSRPWVWAIK
jgi:hypothetical protein